MAELTMYTAVLLDEATFDRVDAVAKAQRRSRAFVIREALAAHLDSLDARDGSPARAA